MKTKDTWLSAWRQGHKGIFDYDSAGARVGRAGDSWAATFWAGYDGLTAGVRAPRRGTMEYSIFAAGKLARKEADRSVDKIK